MSSVIRTKDGRRKRVVGAVCAVYIGTTNDTNGNPRRGWYIVDHAGITCDFIDEGYAGKAELGRLYGGLPTTSRIDVTPGEYRLARRTSREG